jgi:hypothetical protein
MVVVAVAALVHQFQQFKRPQLVNWFLTKSLLPADDHQKCDQYLHVTNPHHIFNNCLGTFQVTRVTVLDPTRNPKGLKMPGNS